MGTHRLKTIIVSSGIFSPANSIYVHKGERFITITWASAQPSGVWLLHLTRCFLVSFKQANFKILHKKSRAPVPLLLTGNTKQRHAQGYSHPPHPQTTTVLCKKSTNLQDSCCPCTQGAKLFTQLRCSRAVPALQVEERADDIFSLPIRNNRPPGW